MCSKTAIESWVAGSGSNLMRLLSKGLMGTDTHETQPMGDGIE